MKEVYSQYMDSIHGFALTKDGLLVAASCSSCHGSHKILSKTDPKQPHQSSAISPSTCGTCHAGAAAGRTWMESTANCMQAGDSARSGVHRLPHGAPDLRVRTR